MMLYYDDDNNESMFYGKFQLPLEMRRNFIFLRFNCKMSSYGHDSSRIKKILIVTSYIFLEMESYRYPLQMNFFMF